MHLLKMRGCDVDIFSARVSIKDYDIVATFKPQYGNYDVFLDAKRRGLKTVTHTIHEMPESYSQYLNVHFQQKWR